VQNLPQWITYSGNAVGAGPATITLAVAGNSGAARAAIVSIAGSSVTVTQTGSGPSIYTGGVVNAASYAAGTPLVPGSLATAYGSYLLATPSTAAGTPLPTNLSGFSMQFGGVLAPLLYADVGQVNFQVPWELAGQTQASLAPALNGQAGTAQTVSLAAFAPGIFARNGQGTGQGAILDNSTYQVTDASHPATAGSTVVQIYCTGLGAVSNRPRRVPPLSVVRFP